MKFCVFIATSLDGFIARKDGSLDWLDAANEKVEKGDDMGYSTFMSDVDLLVMGRNTYEKVLTFGAWPYTVPVLVLSRNAETLPLSLPETHKESAISFSDESPEVLSQRLLEEKKYNKVYLDGGRVIQSFLSLGLVDELTLTTIPVLIGEGAPLFGSLPKDVHLSLIDSQPFKGCGFIQTKYKVVKEDEEEKIK